jgi:hypothetical protein
MNSIERQVTKALSGLGATSQDIANTLANKGVRGHRNCTDVCVLAVYLAEQFPGLTFGVGVGSAAFAELTPMGIKLGGGVPFDQPLIDFVRDFDEGKHHELEAS